MLDDARHFVLTMGEKFDIITSDPIHPWVKGAATLYTREYFEMVQRHLNPGGLVTQWVPLYESTPEVVKSEIATFFEVFPNGTDLGQPQSRRRATTSSCSASGTRPARRHAAAAAAAGRAAPRRCGHLSRRRLRLLLDVLGTYAGHASDLAGG